MQHSPGFLAAIVDKISHNPQANTKALIYEELVKEGIGEEALKSSLHKKITAKKRALVKAGHEELKMARGRVVGVTLPAEGGVPEGGVPEGGDVLHFPQVCEVLETLFPDVPPEDTESLIAYALTFYHRALQNTKLKTEISGAGPMEAFQRKLDSVLEVFTQVGKSSIKGKLAEMVVYDFLLLNFPDFSVEDASKIPHSGDFVINGDIIMDVKNYNCPVNRTQIEKLAFDMATTGARVGIMVSLSSGIVGKKRLDLERTQDNKWIVYVPNASETSLIMAVIVAENLRAVVPPEDIPKESTPEAPPLELDAILEAFSLIEEDLRETISSADLFLEQLASSTFCLVRGFKERLAQKQKKLLELRLRLATGPPRERGADIVPQKESE